MLFLRNSLFAFLVLILIGACAVKPTSEDVSKFGKSATSTVEVLKDARVIQSELLLEGEKQKQLCNYFSSSSKDGYVLGSKPHRQKLKLIGEQSESIDALGKYAKAMQEVTNEGGVAKLRSAANGLAKETGTTFATAGLQGSLVEPIAKFILNGIVNVSEANRRYRIRKIAEQAHNPIRRLTTRVGAENLAIEDALNAHLSDWEDHTKCALEFTREDAAAARMAFLEADARKRSYQKRISALDKGVFLMGLLRDTHEKLYKGEGDFDATLKAFSEQVELLVELKGALET